MFKKNVFNTTFYYYLIVYSIYLLRINLQDIQCTRSVVQRMWYSVSAPDLRFYNTVD